MATEHWLDNKYATIVEYKDAEPHNEDGVRLYKSSIGMFTLQIRTHKGIGEFKPGKPRDMVASVPLTLDQLKELATFAGSC